MKKTISILGSGWLGQPLATHFEKAGFIVNLSTRSKEKFIELKSDRIFPHIVDIKNLSNEISEFLNSEYLIVNITSKDIDGFKSLVEYINNSDIKYVIFVSSTSVYNEYSIEIREDLNIENKAHPLIEIENIFRNSPNFKTTIIRFSGLIGYNRHPGNFFRKGNPIKNPQSPINLIHRDDCIEILSEIIKKSKWNEIYNACSDTHIEKYKFYSFAASLMSAPKPKYNLNETSEIKLISNSKLKKDLQYKFIYPDLLDESVYSTF